MKGTLTLLGTGTSQGVPVIGCDCSVCRSADPRNHRLRTSAWLQLSHQSILIDCSPDFRQQALKFGIHKLDALLLTHIHWDHTAGLDDTRVYTWRNETLPIYLMDDHIKEFRKSFHYVFEPPEQLGGGIPQLQLHGLHPFQLTMIGGIKFESLLVMHGKLKILGYRFGNTAYITDAKTLPEETINALQGIDNLVLNSLRYREHPTHLSIKDALDIIEKIAPRKAFLVHLTHDVDAGDLQVDLPEFVQLGFDGQSIDVVIAE